jgi:3-oxoacyl-[acyl-carrier-protein] synthase-3
MSFITVENISIVGMATAVPTQTSINNNEKFIATTGVAEKRVTDKTICTSDLCLEAAEQLISDLNIDKTDIEVLIFVSQTPDYKLPVTSTILQHKLGLSQACLCLDIPLGCSGYVYGLTTISSLMSTGKIKKGLLLVGDTISKEVDVDDQGTEPLFGDAGTATLLSYDENANPMLFGLGSDGEGYESIIIHNSGARCSNNETKKLFLNGIDVFNFGTNKVPKVVNQFIDNFGLDKDSIDHFVFHQANKFMNDKIYKKLGISVDKTSSSLKHFGNTSSATIPLTIVTELGHIQKGNSMLFCGFGVGLSWGTFYTKINNDIFCSKLIEV